MTQDTEDVVRQMRRESQRVFPLNMRDGHAYHSVAAALDKGADLIQSLSDRIDGLEGALVVPREGLEDALFDSLYDSCGLMGVATRKAAKACVAAIEAHASRAALHQEGIAPK